MKIIRKIDSLNLAILIYDLLTIAASYFLALLLRYDFQFSKIESYALQTYYKVIVWYMLICVIIYCFCGLYDSIWRLDYFDEIKKEGIAFILCICVKLLSITIFGYNPRSYYIFGFVLQIIFTLSIRIIIRLIYLTKNVADKISFSPPDVTELEINEVADTLRSGWITTGPRVKKFENNICDFLNITQGHCVCLNSQTACAEMALRIMGIGEGDEIIVPAYTYTASASVVCHVGAKLVLVDIQKDNLEMDYDAVESLINEKTKAIIPVDLAGIPCDYDRIFKIVENKKDIYKPNNDIQKALGRVAIMADTAHAFGALYKRQMVGSIADFSSFSFHAVKNLTTGEGGALTWKTIPGISDEDIYHKLQLLSLHGQSKDAFHKNKIGAWEYDVVGPWYKCNMTDIVAAIGLKQLERYDELLNERRHFISMYDKALKPLGVQTLNHYDNEHSSSGHLYITRIPNITVDQRNEIIVKMGERGIACNVHYKPLPMFTAYKNLDFDINNYPNAYEFYHNEITLPLHTNLTEKQVKFVIDNYKDILKEYI